MEAATKQTAQDFEDQSQRQLAQFKFGSKSFGPGKLSIESNLMHRLYQHCTNCIKRLTLCLMLTFL